jgi:hypothetical protein
MAKRARRKPLSPLAEAQAALYRLHLTFWQGDNRYGEYGRNVSAAHEGWRQTVLRLTGTLPPSIWENAPGR